MADQPGTIAIVGGTGPLGRGLAARWARAGHHVTLGSRSPDRGREAATKVAEATGVSGVEGADNAAAVRDADMVVIAVPYDGLAGALDAVEDHVGDRVVVSAVNTMTFEGGSPTGIDADGRSAAEICAERLPRARVVGAFHTVSSRRLRDVDAPLDADALVCGDDEDAVAQVVRLAETIDGLRGVACGPLRLARWLEQLTILLIEVNRRHGVQSGVRLTGLDRD